MKVQRCRWECLLCKRSFSTKFCYTLHCKNVHEKGLDESLVEATDIGENRPQKSLINDFGKLQKRIAGAAVDHGRDDESNGSKSEKKEGQTCDICNKKFSSIERLNGHKRLHYIQTDARRSILTKKQNLPKGELLKRARQLNNDRKEQSSGTTDVAIECMFYS